MNSIANLHSAGSLVRAYLSKLDPYQARQKHPPGVPAEAFAVEQKAHLHATVCAVEPCNLEDVLDCRLATRLE